MLKVSSIEFKDQLERIYTISGFQIEAFPLTGGTTSNMIKTKAWNQHGNTFINSFMESYEDNIIFALYTANKTTNEIADARKEIATICNPLNGVIEMKITLNNGLIYYRDITFVSAPIYPIGFENRNQVWQKVQLMYEANNPFWYSDKTITETFQQAIPLFEFPFEMSESDPIEFGSYIPTKIVVNEGQVEAPVIIEIVGACINPIIENVTTGEMIRFKNLTMGADDRLLIDTTFGQKKVILNDVENVFYTLDFSTTFFNLRLGENEIDFRDDTLVTPEATIYFVYRNLYHTI
jgi:Phage tail protein